MFLLPGLRWGIQSQSILWEISASYLKAFGILCLSQRVLNYMCACAVFPYLQFAFDEPLWSEITVCLFLGNFYSLFLHVFSPWLFLWDIFYTCCIIYTHILHIIIHISFIYIIYLFVKGSVTQQRDERQRTAWLPPPAQPTICFRSASPVFSPKPGPTSIWVPRRPHGLYFPFLKPYSFLFLFWHLSFWTGKGANSPHSW